MKTYTTIQGDMWDHIAYTQLGDARYTDQLIALNTQYRETLIFPPGCVLVLPEQTVKINPALPPWRRGAG